MAPYKVKRKREGGTQKPLQKTKALTEKEDEFCKKYQEARRSGEEAIPAADRICEELGLTISGEKMLMRKKIGNAIQVLETDRCRKVVRVIQGMATSREERASLLGEIQRESSTYKVGDRLKAIELAGKMEGDYIDRKQVEVRAMVQNVKDMTTEELERLVAEELEKAGKGENNA